MPDVAMYYLDSGNERTKLEIACRLVAKAYRASFRTFVVMHDEAAVHEFDELLWQQPSRRFLPHEIYAEQSSALIQLGAAVPPTDAWHMLINIRNEFPPRLHNFNRVLDVVLPDEQSSAEQRVRQYTSACEHPPTVHQVTVRS